MRTTREPLVEGLREKQPVEEAKASQEGQRKDRPNPKAIESPDSLGGRGSGRCYRNQAGKKAEDIERLEQAIGDHPGRGKAQGQPDTDRHEKDTRIDLKLPLQIGPNHSPTRMKTDR